MASLRITTTGAALAALATWTPLAAAAPGEVLAYGRDAGGICLYDDPVTLPEGVRVRADQACRLVVAPQATFANPNASPSYQPKVRDDGSPAGGTVPVPGVSVGTIGSVGQATDEAAGYDLYEAWAVWAYWSENGAEIYHDELRLLVRRSRRDGTFAQIVKAEGYCQAGVAAFPHRPSVKDCRWEGTVSRPELSFVSSGQYSDHLLLVPYDDRKIAMGAQITADGGIERSCPMLVSLPKDWQTTTCDIGLRRIGAAA